MIIDYNHNYMAGYSRNDNIPKNKMYLCKYVKNNKTGTGTLAIYVHILHSYPSPFLLLEHKIQ